MDHSSSVSLAESREQKSQMHPSSSSSSPSKCWFNACSDSSFVIKGYCSPSRFLSSSGKNEFSLRIGWEVADTSFLLSPTPSSLLVNWLFLPCDHETPVSGNISRIKNVSRFPESRKRDRDSFPGLNDRSWTRKIGIITSRAFLLLLSPPFPPSFERRSHSWLDFDALCKLHRSHVAENWKKSFSLSMH